MFRLSIQIKEAIIFLFKERLKIAKLARQYEEDNNIEGILRNKVFEESWKWHTPGNTPVNKSVHFDSN